MASTPPRTASFGEYFKILARRRIYLITIIPASILGSVFLAYFLEPSYRSSATILLEPSSIPPELVQTTVTSYADQQIELVQRRVMSPDKVAELVSRQDPYPDEPTLTVKDKARLLVDSIEIERVDPITMDVLKESNAFSIHYHNADPARSATIAREIADLFLNYNRQTRNERASEAYEFLSQQSQNLDKRIGDLEKRLAEFRSRHGDVMPESAFRNQAAAERASAELLGLESQLRAAEERKVQLTMQLSKTTRSLFTTSGNWQTELATLQAQLADARVRYTPDHPDVKRLQRQIETLSANSGSATSDEGAAMNPEYAALRSQLASIDREIAALQAGASRARSQIYNYTSQSTVPPDVAAEYAELTRERDVTRAQFTDIQNKLQEANVARSLESEQKGERFTMIRAPTIPDAPYSPNRLGLIVLGIVLGFGVAVGIAALVESTDQTIRSGNDLAELTTLPVIARIPVLQSRDDRRKMFVWWGAYVSSLAIATAVVAATVITR